MTDAITEIYEQQRIESDGQRLSIEEREALVLVDIANRLASISEKLLAIYGAKQSRRNQCTQHPSH
jgi:hypothetical protein